MVGKNRFSVENFSKILLSYILNRFTEQTDKQCFPFQPLEFISSTHSISPTRPSNSTCISFFKLKLRPWEVDFNQLTTPVSGFETQHKKRTKKMDVYWLFLEFCNISTIVLCLILKVPQIWNIISSRSVQGLSIPGILLELSA